jgi:hypothetical protein
VTIHGVTQKEASLLPVGDWAAGPSHLLMDLDAKSILVNLRGPVVPREHASVSAPGAFRGLPTRSLPRDLGKSALSPTDNHFTNRGARWLSASTGTLARMGSARFGGRDILEAGRPAHEGGPATGGQVDALGSRQFEAVRKTSRETDWPSSPPASPSTTSSEVRVESVTPPRLFKGTRARARRVTSLLERTSGRDR